ncbi:MAG TPA: hypothetical protein VMY77_16050, partial [Chitinophagaceae bacterium]|nr:hypothetical protein [Chitinophagaceae bacterium]
VTPGAENIIRQTYLESVNSIIRIDQFFLDGELIVSAFVFDAQGNLIRRKQIENVIFTGTKSPVPFYVAQSSDKTVVLLIETLIVDDDNISVLSIVFDELLNVSTPRKFNVAFKPALFDLYMPLVNNDKTVFIPTVDKFNSYKLSSVVNGYLLKHTENNPKAIQFNFERKKIKELNFQFSGDKIIFTGLYSTEKNKNDVAGVFYSGYDLKEQQYVKTEEYGFSDNVKAALKKTYGAERRKGNLLNYLSFFPTPFAADAKYSYAVLLPERKTPIIVPSSSSASQTNELGQIKHQAGTASSYIGTQPSGYSRPMNAAEAAAYAAVYSWQTTSPNYQGWDPNPPQKIRQRVYDKNLLFFDFKNADPEASHRFLKIKNAADPAYEFFAYIPAADGLGALHYIVPDFGTPYLKRSIISANGKLAEKKVFEDRNRILLPDYPFVLDEETLTSFYEDKITGQMGLIRLKL